MYINTITAKSIHNCETRSVCIESDLALTIPDIRETMLENGWIVLSVFNDLLTPDRIIN